MNPVWLILIMPLAAALLITLVTRPLKQVSALLSIAASVGGFGISCWLLRMLAQGQLETVLPAPIPWLHIGDVLHLDLTVTLDRLSILMLLVVTGVGSAIQIFATGYMQGDKGYSRFFACMSLFMFSMLGIVLAGNFIQMFMFWELVGLSSYLLIGFWFERPSAAEAAKKAFLVNRIGDFGFMLGILLVWSQTGSFDFAQLKALWPVAGAAKFVLMAAPLLIFCGAVGKSAQFPLHVWLPDAMEGPTPVSALIHAATMVAAGVYMMCRVDFLLLPSPEAMAVVAWTGGITALMAAMIAVVQRDIKRILAYSTLSQLGYMIMAVGLGGSIPAMFHLTTHAFFKALLFLAAGSVIIGYHHEQDIWKMGAVFRRMPVTSMAFLIGTLALAGVWPLSGFYSKDEILLLAHGHNLGLFILAAFTAFLTSFYMGRAFLVVFMGKARDHHLYEHAHESPWMMTLPLAFLAALSVVGGWGSVIPSFLNPEGHGEHAGMLGWALLAIPASGFLLSALIYNKAQPSDAPVARVLGPVFQWLENKFYFDELYLGIVKYVQGSIACLCDFFDRWIVQGVVVGGVTFLMSACGWGVRTLQNGQLSFYAFALGAGVAAILYFVLMP